LVHEIVIIFLGNPPPVVVWLKNDQVVDDECEHNSVNAIENRLHWPSVSRHDFGSVFTCQASNTKLMDPRQASVVLDLRREYIYLIIYFKLRKGSLYFVCYFIMLSKNSLVLLKFVVVILSGDTFKIWSIITIQRRTTPNK